MTDLRQAAEKALEVLECAAFKQDDDWETNDYEKVNSARATIRAALEQPQCEPVPVGAWVNDCVEWTENPYKFKNGQKLYTTPQRQPLTFAQQLKIVSKAQEEEWDEYQLIEAIEAAHGIKEGA